MDPHFKKYQYIESQRENYIDLTNEPIKNFALLLFSKSKFDLENDRSALILDENMNEIDTFCMLTEILLYGINILTNGSIFDLESKYDKIINIIKAYFASCYIDINIKDYNNETYYVCINKKTNKNTWKVLDYDLDINENGEFNIFFESNNKKKFIINFMFKNIYN